MFRRSFFPADKVYCSAISAIDIALWDIKGKAVGVPVYKLLGGPVRDKVVCYPHTQGATTAELVENCRRVQAEGWKFARWGLSDSGGSEGRTGRLEPVEAIPLAEEQMAAVREAVGPSLQLCLDVHTRLDTTHVISLCKVLEPYRPFFIEDPIRSENPGSYRTLARHVSLPIAAGEQWASKWPFRQVIEEELISYARIDLCIVGGLTEALKITHWVRDPLHRHSPPQPPGARQRGGVRRPLHGVDQRGRPRDAPASRELLHGPVPKADRLGGRLRLRPGRARLGSGAGRGVGGLAARGDDQLGAAPAPQRRRLHQLVVRVMRPRCR